MQNIILLGLVSFFADISTEMVYPLIPLYLTASFGATPLLIGIIEGFAESAASLLRVFSGYLSDKYPYKKFIAFVGYSCATFYKFILLIATSWVGILFARILDCIGKGLRTSPRNVIVSESSPKDSIGESFGIHKALDMTGSAIGIFITYLLLANLDQDFNYKTVFIVSIIPALIALIVLSLVKENKAKVDIEENIAEKPSFKSFKKIDKNLKLYLLVVLVFTLGNSSNNFLLLKAQEIGFSADKVVLLYFIYTITAAFLSVPFGTLSDKIGRKKVLVSGYFIFSLVYLGFALIQIPQLMVINFILYGFYTALVTGAERAMISEISPPELKGTMLGLHSTIVGLALLPASFIAGILWTSLGSFSPFVLGSFLSLCACTTLIILLNKMPQKTSYKGL